MVTAFSQIIDQVTHWWKNLQPRERLLLSICTGLIGLMLVYGYHKQTWYKAIDILEVEIPMKRADLTWMQRQAEILQVNGGIPVKSSQNSGKSMLSIIEQTAKNKNLRKAIVQMSPGDKANQVKVNMVNVDFNLWLQWIEALQQGDQINVQQASINKKQPNQADIRITFERS